MRVARARGLQPLAAPYAALGGPSEFEPIICLRRVRRLLVEFDGVGVASLSERDVAEARARDGAIEARGQEARGRRVAVACGEDVLEVRLRCARVAAFIIYAPEAEFAGDVSRVERVSVEAGAGRTGGWCIVAGDLRECVRGRLRCAGRQDLRAAAMVQDDAIGLREVGRVDVDRLRRIVRCFQFELEFVPDVERIHDGAARLIRAVHTVADEAVGTIAREVRVHVLDGIALLVGHAQVHAPDAVRALRRVPHVRRHHWRYARRFVGTVAAQTCARETGQERGTDRSERDRAARVVVAAVAVAIASARADAARVVLLVRPADLCEGSLRFVVAAGEVVGLAEFGEHQVCVRRLVPSVIPVGGRLVVRERRVVLPLPQVDVAERVVGRGRAHLIARVRELLERRVAERQRLIGAIAPHERLTLSERVQGLRDGRVGLLWRARRRIGGDAHGAERNGSENDCEQGGQRRAGATTEHVRLPDDREAERLCARRLGHLKRVSCVGRDCKRS